mmetsp:Transcript_10481/g.33202  ORF Transcript_10481/g.33202 Transcript_10481/m.33202 type:complete len:214 (+) Transcript_10481:181-822(+)
MKCTHTYGKCLPGERGLSARSLRRAPLLHVSKHALHHGLVKGAVGRVVAARHCDEAERVDHPDGAERPRAARVVPHLAGRQLGAAHPRQRDAAHRVGGGRLLRRGAHHAERGVPLGWHTLPRVEPSPARRRRPDRPLGPAQRVAHRRRKGVGDQRGELRGAAEPPARLAHVGHLDGLLRRAAEHPARLDSPGQGVVAEADLYTRAAEDRVAAE